MSTHKHKIGIKDIAAKANVSIGTVDRVLHNRGEVKQETREKVLKIVEELGYSPNIMARSLAQKHEIRICVMVQNFDATNPYWELACLGIEKAREELAQYNIDILHLFFDGSDEQSFKSALTKVLEYQPNGVVFNPVFKDTSLKFVTDLKRRDIPYICIDINLDDKNSLAFFGQNAFHSGQVAGRLMSLTLHGPAQVIILKMGRNKVFSRHIEQRIAGFKQLLEPKKEINLNTYEIDLSKANEPDKSLSGIFEKHDKIHGLFIPNSRLFTIKSFLQSIKNIEHTTIGYDLIEQNIACLKSGLATFLISQNPVEQAHQAITSLFYYIMTAKPVARNNFSAIDIIIKENVDDYKKIKYELH